MPLRPELRPPPVDASTVDELGVEIDRITELLESGEDADDDIAAFNARTGHGYTAGDFWHYWEHVSVIEFAREAARPRPTRDAGITRQDLVEIVRLAQAQDEDARYYLALFRANVAPASLRVDLDTTRDAEQIVDEALRGAAPSM